MKSRIAAALILVTFFSIPVFAGSTGPNPKGLQKEARAALSDEATVRAEVRTALTRIAESRSLAERLDAATRANNREQVVTLLREAGFKKSKIEVTDIDPDMRITIKACWGKFCITISISW